MEGGKEPVNPGNRSKKMRLRLVRVPMEGGILSAHLKPPAPVNEILDKAMTLPFAS
jgi:hypothetical protein